jgi:hypothetical protein
MEGLGKQLPGLTPPIWRSPPPGNCALHSSPIMLPIWSVRFNIITCSIRPSHLGSRLSHHPFCPAPLSFCHASTQDHYPSCLYHQIICRLSFVVYHLSNHMSFFIYQIRCRLSFIIYQIICRLSRCLLRIRLRTARSFDPR